MYFISLLNINFTGLSSVPISLQTMYYIALLIIHSNAYINTLAIAQCNINGFMYISDFF